MKYTEILKLKDMLEKANIPFEFTDDLYGVKNYNMNWFMPDNYPAYQIRIGNLCDAVEDWSSYDNEQDLLEIMGGLTAEEQLSDEVLGWLTAEEVFKRFKYCYENNTSIYEGNDNEN